MMIEKPKTESEQEFFIFIITSTSTGITVPNTPLNFLLNLYLNEKGNQDRR